MTGIGIQLAPRAGPDIVYGLDPADPERFVIRGTWLRPRLLLGLGILFFACGSQLDAWRSGNAGSFVGATIVASLGAAAAFVRRRLVLDRAQDEVHEEFAVVFPFARRSRVLSHFRQVVVSLENRPAAHGRETVYPIDLQASATRIRVGAVGRWEHTAPLSEALARFLDRPLRDLYRGGVVEVPDLDAPLRDEPAERAAAFKPKPMSSRVVSDRKELLEVWIPRPAVPQTLFLNGILLVFCVLPLLLEIVIPVWRGFRPESAWGAFLSVGWLLLPALFVGGGSILHVARNGGFLSVTPRSVRFRRHGVLRRPEVEIPAESIEDLVILEPEMGGSRSLLAYFSGGVLVVRSDQLSFRVGYGLRIPELEWLRDRIREVMGEAGGRRTAPVVPAERALASGASGPVFPRWSRAWLGMVGGGFVGWWTGGPLGVGVALPYLEHLLNLGAVLGLLAAAATTPSLWKNRARRRVLTAIAVVLALSTLLGLAGGADWVQAAPRHAPGTAWGAERERIGFFPFGAMANALLLNALLVLVLQAKGSEWRIRIHHSLLVPQAQGMARRFEGLSPRSFGAALITAVSLVALSWPAWWVDSGRRADPASFASEAHEGARTEPRRSPTRPTPDRSGPSSRSEAGLSRLALPPELPAVVPLIETVADLDLFLAALTGRPVLLLYWSGEEPRQWLSDADRLHRGFAARGLEVIGVPRAQHEGPLREMLGAARIGWRQVIGASVWRSRLPTGWPQVVLLDASGEIVYRGRPGRKVDEALVGLLGSPSRPLVETQGVVSGRLVYAGRPLHEVSTAPVRFWFRDEWTGREARLQTETNPAASEFRFVGPIGTYLVSAFSGPRLDFPPHVSWSGSLTFAVSAGDARHQDVALERILRLREPVDNAKTLPPHPNRFDHPSPVRFAWDAVPEANVYRYSLSREGDRSSGPLAGETVSPFIELSLSPGAYQLRLTAHGPSGLLGRLETYGDNYRAWAYSFAVR